MHLVYSGRTLRYRQRALVAAGDDSCCCETKPTPGPCCAPRSVRACEGDTPCVDCGNAYRVEWSLTMSVSFESNAGSFEQHDSVLAVSGSGQTALRCGAGGHLVVNPDRTFAQGSGTATAFYFIPGEFPTGPFNHSEEWAGSWRATDEQQPDNPEAWLLPLSRAAVAVFCPLQIEPNLLPGVRLWRVLTNEVDQAFLSSMPGGHFYPQRWSAAPGFSAFSIFSPLTQYPGGHPYREPGFFIPLDFGNPYPHIAVEYESIPIPQELRCEQRLTGERGYVGNTGSVGAEFTYEPNATIVPGMQHAYQWTKQWEAGYNGNPNDVGLWFVNLAYNVTVIREDNCDPSPCEQNFGFRDIFRLIREGL